MKTDIRHRRQQGFTLVELLVVVSLIAILAALTMGGLSMVTQKTARDKASVQLKLLESALQDYNAENRSFPVNEDPLGNNGSEVLYRALYKDGVDANTRVYRAELDPETNKEGVNGQQWMRRSGSTAEIIDPFGFPYRYRTGANARNNDFDLWSVGKDGKTNADPKHKDCNDDIRNF